MSRRLLIAEFVPPDPMLYFHGALLAHVAGLARAAGDEVRWLAFGVEAPEPGRPGLGEPDAAALGAAVRGFAPTHVLHTELPVPDLDARLREAAPGARVVAARRLAPRMLLQARAGAVVAALDGTPAPAEAGPLLVEAAQPDWTCELRNDAARERRPYIGLVAGPRCFYLRSLEGNAAYDGVDLAHAYRRGGCTFCDNPPAPAAFRPACDPIELGIRQIRAAVATVPRERFSGTFRCESSAFFLEIGRLGEAVLAAGLAPSTFLFTPRLDELVARADVLRTLLPRLRAAGHRLAVYGMGVENFSPAENARFHKGIAEPDVRRALALRREFDRDHPGAVVFGVPSTRTGMLGFILFTPWTTLADLRLNVEAGRRLDVDPWDPGNPRLRLLAGRPITLLAQRDGLVLDAPAAAPDGPVASAPDPDADVEVPWRFRDPAVAAVHRVLTLDLARDRADELRAERLRAAKARFPGPGPRPGRLLAWVLEALEEAPISGDPDERVEELTGRLERRLEREAAALPAPAAMAAPPVAAQAPREEARPRRPGADLAIDQLAGLLHAPDAGPAALAPGLRAAAAALCGVHAGPGEVRDALRRAAAGLVEPVTPEALLERLEALAAQAPPAAEPGPADARGAAPAAARDAEQLVANLRDALAILARRADRQLGRIAADTPVLVCPADAPWELVALVRGEREQVEVRIRPAEAGAAGLHRTAHFAVFHGRATPADTPWKRRMLAWAVEALERRMHPAATKGGAG